MKYKVNEFDIVRPVIIDCISDLRTEILENEEYIQQTFRSVIFQFGEDGYYFLKVQTIKSRLLQTMYGKNNL